MSAPARRVVDTAAGPVVLNGDEELVSAELCPVLAPAAPETPLQVLARTAGVDDPRLIGAAGPVIASAANPENAGEPELRRYEAVFARDALYSAAFLTDRFPSLEQNTVLFLAARQAERADPAARAEPGKVPHHVRDPDDPLARRLTEERGRHWPWFGGTDATVLFLAAAVRLLRRDPGLADEPLDRDGVPVLRAGAPHTLRRAVAAATRWLLGHLTGGPVPGLLWVPLNDADSFTTWTDSPNAFSHADGTLVEPPVAPVSLQGQVHDVLRGLAGLVAGTRTAPLALAGDLPAARLSAAADHVLRAVHARFTSTSAPGRVASALDGRGAAPVTTTTVDVGITLGSGLWAATPRTRDAIVAAVLGPDMLTPFGISGRDRRHVRWSPFDYHSQVWGFATHLVAAGLRDQGFTAEAEDLDERLLKQTADGLLPENVGSGSSAERELCGRIVTVRRPAPGGRETVTVKERPPAPYAAWTAAAVVAVADRRDGAGRRPT